MSESQSHGNEPLTPLDAGLDEAAVAVSRNAHGENRLTPLQEPTLWSMIVDSLGDPMLRILIVCAVISLGVGVAHGSVVDGLAILVAVVIVTLVGIYNQRRARRDYRALESIASRQPVRARRSGRETLIDAADVVVGDVLVCRSGDIVPADAVVRQSDSLVLSEAHVSGEPETEKGDGDAVFAGSRVLDGSCALQVRSVGDATVFGAARLDAAAPDAATPLEERLDGLAKRIGVAGMVAAAATLLALLFSGWIRGTAPSFGWNEPFLRFVLDALTIAVTIVVVAVPEGLPLAVTLSLAYTTRKMASDQALVRKLEACETMGAATVVCSDKTGTLTSGGMTPVVIHLRGSDYRAQELRDALSDRDNAEVIERGLLLNSTGDVVEVDGVLQVVGNHTDRAVTQWCIDHGMDPARVRRESVVVGRTEFNSTRKYMATALAVGGGHELLVKGAPERVIGASTSVVGATIDGPLDDDGRAAISASITDHTQRGRRVLSLARRLIGSREWTHQPDDDLRDLSYLGHLVVADPIRAEVPDAVELARQAGVRVMMITGDSPATARQIASEAGIVSERVLEGDVLRSLADEQLSEELKATSVIARALPADKRRIVSLLQRQGHVVAVTGDGVNDAPALALADVGFAMGSGAQVAREASDVVIVDDNFATIVRAIRWGRSVFENIRKFLQFQLTVNVVALTVALVAALTGRGTPLNAVQLLWVNLIMDSLAALALALEPPTDALLRQRPHGRHEPLISRPMWFSTLAMGAYMTAVCFVVLYTDWLTPTQASPIQRASLLFNVFVAMQIANEINCRTVRPHRSPFAGLWRSHAFLTVVAIVIAVQVFAMTIGRRLFRVVEIGGRGWLVSLFAAASVTVVGFIVRTLARAIGGSPRVELTS